MLVRTLVAVLLAAGTFASQPASASDSSPGVLRRLVYELHMVVTAKRSIEHAPLHAYDSTHGDTVGALESRGVVHVDVIAASTDGGLVADVSEDATSRSRPKVRVAIQSDGVLSYDPKQAANVSEEEAALLRWLARGFYGDHPREPGAAWNVDVSGNGVADVVRYRVVEATAATVTLHYDDQRTAHGVGGYDAMRTGTLVYDTGRIVPLRVGYQGWSHSGRSGSFDTTDVSVELVLSADSFAK